MVDHHAGAGVAHNLLDFIPHFGVIAVNGAFGAGRFVISKRAPDNPVSGIIEQFLTTIAQFIPKEMFVMAVNANHGFDGLMFTA